MMQAIWFKLSAVKSKQFSKRKKIFSYRKIYFHKFSFSSLFSLWHWEVPQIFHVISVKIRWRCWDTSCFHRRKEIFMNFLKRKVSFKNVRKRWPVVRQAAARTSGSCMPNKNKLLIFIVGFSYNWVNYPTRRYIFQLSKWNEINKMCRG